MRKTLITIAAIGGVYLLYKYLNRNKNKNEQEVASGSNVIQETIAIARSKPQVNPSYQLLSFPEKKDKKVEKKNLNVKTFKNPTIEFVVQFISDFAATIIVKDISNLTNIKVISSTRYTKSSKDELVVEIKSQLLTLQSTYPLWKLTSTDPSLAALPKLYPPTPLDTKIYATILKM